MKDLVKRGVKKILPAPIMNVFRLMWQRAGLNQFRGTSIEEAFDTIYKRGLWGKGSGIGSYGLWAENYVEFLKKFISHEGIRSITDIGCGDFNIGSQIAGLVENYNACDVSAFIINQNINTSNLSNVKFIKLNACTESIPTADLVTIRQVLQHLTNAEIEQILQNVEASGARVCVVAEHLPPENALDAPNKNIPSHSAQTRNIISSGVMINMPPFSRKASVQWAYELPDTGDRLAIFVYYLNDADQGSGSV